MNALTTGTMVRNTHTGMTGTVSAELEGGYVTVRDAIGITYGPMLRGNWTAVPLAAEIYADSSAPEPFERVTPCTPEFAGALLDWWTGAGAEIRQLQRSGVFYAEFPDGRVGLIGHGLGERY